MKKLILLTLICLFFSSLPVWSQDSKLMWTGPNDKTGKMKPEKVVGKDETGIYVLLKENAFSIRRMLAKYDLNMNYQWTIPLEVTISKRTAGYVDLIFTSNKIILFISDYDKDTKLKKLYATTVSKAGIIDPNFKEIQSFKNVVSPYSVPVTVRLNKEESIVITSTSTNELKNTFTQIIKIHEDLSIQSTNEYELPFIEGNVVWSTGTFDASYNYYCSYSIIDLKEKEKNPEKKSYFFTYDQKTKEKKQYELIIENYQMDMHFISLDTLNGRYINIFGYYADKKEFALAGTFLFRFDILNKKMNLVSIKPFAADLVNSVRNIKMSDGNSIASNSPSATFKEYSIKNVYVSENGDKIVISEQRSEASAGSDANGYSPVTYRFGNVLITTFNAAGHATWSTVIPKYQRTTQYDGASIGSFMYKNELHFMYLDNTKNGLTLSSDQYMIAGSPDKLALVMIKINANDQVMEKSAVSQPSLDKKGIDINAAALIQIENEVFLIGHQEGNYKIGRMILK